MTGEHVMKIQLTEKRRHHLSSVVLLLGLGMMPMSVWLIAVAVYVRFVVDEELELVQGLDTVTLPYLLGFTGML